MKDLLEVILTRMELGVEFDVFAFSGKTDLEAKAPQRVRSWGETPGVETRFVVMRDKDKEDCVVLKTRLMELCTGHGHKVIVRIVVQEMESWLLGDLAAVADAYGKPALARLAGKQLYKDPDAIGNASEQLTKLTNDRGKRVRAGRIAPHMDPERNASVSFRVFCAGVRRLAETG